MDKIYAPYIDNLFFGTRGYDDGLDEKSNVLWNKLFKLMERFENINDIGGERHSLYITADKGTAEYFLENSGLYSEDDKLDESIEQEFNEIYPNEKVWYNIYTIDENGYRILGINGKVAVSTNPNTKVNEWYDLADFLEWVISGVNWAIELSEKGEYNRFVEKELSNNMKTGKILRKYLWDIYPESRKEYNEHIGSRDRIKFIKNMQEQFSKYIDNKPNSRIKNMTAKDFFEACAAGYAGIGSNEDLGSHWNKNSTPIEQYKQCADGRDDGLYEVRYESIDDFRDWIHKKGRFKGRFGGHPWEVCRGGNSTHISLYVDYDNEGYWFSVSGLSFGRSAEAIKFFNGIKDAGYPVIMNNALQMYNRATEADYVGIVPHYRMTCYIDSIFNDEMIVDAIQLPEENLDKLLPLIKWLDTEKIYLRG